MEDRLLSTWTVAEVRPHARPVPAHARRIRRLVRRLFLVDTAVRSVLSCTQKAATTRGSPKLGVDFIVPHTANIVASRHLRRQDGD